MAFVSRKKGPPPQFPRLAFFILRFVQLLCSLVTFGIIGYFVYHLWRDDYRVPYEFSLLDLAAAATFINAFITSLLLCCRSLSPLTVIIIDGLLTVLWSVAFGLLLKAMGSTTTEKCDISGWGNDAGVKVCQMFKGLVAFSVLAILSLVAMVITAIIARKKLAKGGAHKYAPALNPANIASVNTAYKGGNGGDAAAVPAPYGAPSYKSGKGDDDVVPAPYGTPSPPPAYNSPDQVGQKPQGHAATYYG